MNQYRLLALSFLFPSPGSAGAGASSMSTNRFAYLDGGRLVLDRPCRDATVDRIPVRPSRAAPSLRRPFDRGQQIVEGLERLVAVDEFARLAAIPMEAPTQALLFGGTPAFEVPQLPSVAPGIVHRPRQ